ncbi:S1C family serine protease [Salana multivorans]
MDEQNSAGPVYPPVRRSGQPGEASGTSADSHAPHEVAGDHVIWGSTRSEPTAPVPAPAAGDGAGAAGGAAAMAAQPAQSRRMWPAVAASALLAALLASGGTALATGAFNQNAAASSYEGLGAATPVSVSSTTDVEWQAIAAQVRDSVVAISVTTAQGSGAGSGVVIDADGGYIVTNNHVVADAANGGISVTLADGRIFQASVVGTDPTTDVAVIQLTDAPSDLVASPWGDSSEVVVGEDVMAVGNPLGLASTVTTGIVSAVDRPVSTTGEETPVVTNAIQIDAAINPGNSGGPLFNTAGEVIGINSSIASTASSSGQAGSIGLGFAIPSNQARTVAEQLIENGVAQHAYLGVTLSDATATADGVTRAGAKVESVATDTPAASAGLKAGDVVVGINSRAVGGAESLTGFVRQFGAGDEVTLTVVRGGEAIDVNVVLAEKPVEETQSGSGQSQDGSGQDGSGDGGQGWQLPDFPSLPGFGGNG